MTWVTFLKDKSKAFGRFKVFRSLVEKESGPTIKCLRLDKGGEFTSNEFVEYCEKHGIKDNILYLEQHSRMALWKGKIEW